MRKISGFIVATLLISLFLAPCITVDVDSAELPPPTPSTSWVVTTTTTYSALPFVDGDDITVNAGGVLTYDLTNADGSIDVSGIDVNIGGIHIQDPGTRLDINTGTDIKVGEGGQWRSLGTSGSRCTIRGESTTSGTHYIRTYLGGKIFMDYTDVSYFFLLGIYKGGTVELHNSTVSNMGYNLFGHSYTGKFFLVNCTISADTASRYILVATYDAYYYCIGCTFTSTTDNYLANTGYFGQFIFADCTYQGVAIDSGDLPQTTQDIDVRIYEKSNITEGNGVACASISPHHPSIDGYGMLYDDTNYLKIPGFLSFSRTNSTGISELYLLERNGYWRSGLAVGSRTWKYWSDSGQSETGDNQKWNVTVAKSGYVTDYDTQWSGVPFWVNLTALPPYEPFVTITSSIRSYNESTCTNQTVRVGWNETIYFNGTIQTSASMSTTSVNASVYNTTGVWLQTVFSTNHNFQANTSVNLTELNSDSVCNYTTTNLGMYQFRVMVNHSSGTMVNITDILDFQFKNHTDWYNTSTGTPGGPTGGISGDHPVYVGNDTAWDEFAGDAGLYISNTAWQWAAIIILAFLAIFLIIYIRKKKRKR